MNLLVGLLTYGAVLMALTSLPSSDIEGGYLFRVLSAILAGLLVSLLLWRSDQNRIK